MIQQSLTPYAHAQVVANFDFVLTWVSVSEFAFAPPTKKEVQAGCFQESSTRCMQSVQT